MEFCTRLDMCVPSGPKPKDEPSLTSKITGKCKAKVLTTSTTSLDERKFYCKIHGHNMTHHTKDCFEMK
eukprot:6669081-Ditylum_brightwellii.AAC.1